MKYLDLCVYPSANRVKSNTDFETVPQFLSATITDIMYSAADGECTVAAAKHYLESTLPSYDETPIVLPFIKSKAFMSTVAEAFSPVSVLVVEGDHLTSIAPTTIH